MPSNKNQLKQKALETTGKNETVHHTAAICPVLEKGVVKLKIVKIGFTLSGECVSIEQVAEGKGEQSAFALLQKHLVMSGALDLKSLRQKIIELKAEHEAAKNRKESNESSN